MNCPIFEERLRDVEKAGVDMLRGRRERRHEEDDEDEGGRFGRSGGKRKRGGFFESIGDLFGD